MADLPAILLLVSGSLAGLLLIPFGLPGLWVMVLGMLAYGWLTGFQAVTAPSSRSPSHWPYWAR